MSYPSEVLADSPEIYWRLGEPSGTTAADSSGNGHDGTIRNGPTLGVTGLLVGDANTAIGFDGFAAGTAVDSDDTFGPTTYATFAFECLVDVPGTGGSGELCFLSGPASPDVIEFAFDESGPFVRGSFSGTSAFSDGTEATVAPGVHHLVYEFTGTQEILYVDGVVADTQAFVDAGVLLTTADQFVVGNQISPYGVGATLTIDEAAFYTHDLGPTRVAAHYAAATTSTGPTVTVVPDNGPIAGGTSVVITGTDFTGTTAVKFGVTDAASFTVDNDLQITADSPAHTAGTVHVRVTTPAGTSATSGADQFTFTDVPVVTITTDYQWQLDTTLYGAGVNGLWLDQAIEGLGVPDAKTQDVEWAHRSGSYGNPDLSQIRVVTIPAIIKAANESDAFDFLEDLTVDWTPRPADVALAFQLPGWDVFYVLGRPRGVTADVTLARRGVIRVLLRFDCLNPEVVFVP